MTTQSSPVITDMKVIPVAGHDSMLLNIGGAHNAYFTRNIVVLTDNAGQRSDLSDAGRCYSDGIRPGSRPPEQSGAAGA